MSGQVPFTCKALRAPAGVERPMCSGPLCSGSFLGVPIQENAPGNILIFGALLFHLGQPSETSFSFCLVEPLFEAIPGLQFPEGSDKIACGVEL